MKIKANADFGKRECPSCGVVVDGNQNYCPICKYAFPHPNSYRKIVVPIVAVLLIAILLMMAT